VPTRQRPLLASSRLAWGAAVAVSLYLGACAADGTVLGDASISGSSSTSEAIAIDESAAEAISGFESSSTSLGSNTTSIDGDADADTGDTSITSISTTSVAPPTSSTTATSTTATTTIVASTTTAVATTATPTTATPTSTVAPSATLPIPETTPEFGWSISLITSDTAARMTHSWREGCPVGLDELRLLTLSHWNFDGRSTTGELIVRADAAELLVSVFRTLYEGYFPIERMELVDVYSGDDNLSMAANNTSAFNCREVAWKPGVWSNHALGAAIDINPLVNPYVSNTQILPPEGAPFADRSTPTLGGIYAGDLVTQAFGNIGWGWGGTWSTAKDWQHFSASGG